MNNNDLNKNNDFKETHDISVYLPNPTASSQKPDKIKKYAIKSLMVFFLVIDLIVILLCFIKYTADTIIITGTIVTVSFGLLYGAYRLYAFKKGGEISPIVKRIESIASYALIGIIFLANVIFYSALTWLAFKYTFITRSMDFAFMLIYSVPIIYFDIYSFPIVFAFFDRKQTKITIIAKLVGMVVAMIATTLYYPLMPAVVTLYLRSFFSGLVS